MTIELEHKRKFLRVFDVITSKGNQSGGLYQFDGMKAWHDFDGYTCWLGYGDLTVTLYFPGKYPLVTGDDIYQEDFIGKVDQMLAKESGK